VEASDDDIWTKEKQRRTKSSNEDLMIGDDVILGRFVWMPLPLPLGTAVAVAVAVAVDPERRCPCVVVGDRQYAVCSIQYNSITNHQSPW
jgi:hypothetical protein